MITNAKNENPHCVILTGDLNAHLKQWYGNKDDNFGITFQRIFDKHGITQLICEPTFITNKSSIQQCIVKPLCRHKITRSIVHNTLIAWVTMQTMNISLYK